MKPDLVMTALMLNGCVMFLPAFVMWPVMFDGFALFKKIRVGLLALGITVIATGLTLLVCFHQSWVIMLPGSVFVVATMITFSTLGRKYPLPYRPW